MEAEWNTGLRQDVLNFDVEAAFTATAKVDGDSLAHLKWDGIVLWLDLIFWTKDNVSVYLLGFILY